MSKLNYEDLPPEVKAKLPKISRPRQHMSKADRQLIMSTAAALMGVLERCKLPPQYWSKALAQASRWARSSKRR